MVVSFTADCGERERGGSTKTLAHDYILRSSEKPQRCYSLRATAVPGLGVLRRRCDFAEFSAEKCGCLLGSTLLFVHRQIAWRYTMCILFGKSAIPFVPR